MRYRVAFSRLLNGVVIVFTLAYAAAVAITVIAYFGLFGAEPTPFAGIFLIPLGLPWVVLPDMLLPSIPDPFPAVWAFIAPLINLGLLLLLLRALRRWSARGEA